MKAKFIRQFDNWCGYSCAYLYKLPRSRKFSRVKGLIVNYVMIVAFTEDIYSRSETMKVFWVSEEGEMMCPIPLSVLGGISHEQALDELYDNTYDVGFSIPFIAVVVFVVIILTLISLAAIGVY